MLVMPNPRFGAFLLSMFKFARTTLVGCSLLVRCAFAAEDVAVADRVNRVTMNCFLNRVFERGLLKSTTCHIPIRATARRRQFA